jgi:CRP/FNR family transcriptional regulator, cyclic AMP receptor protein
MAPAQRLRNCNRASWEELAAAPEPRSARLLDLDPELASWVPEERRTEARAALVARTMTVQRGRWEPPVEVDPRHLGFLVLEGLLAREVVLAGTTCTELFGEGDLLHPLTATAEDSLVHHRVLWHVLEPVRLAVLDEHFSRSMLAWPHVMRSLLDRALGGARRSSIYAALQQLSPVETRLLVLFWCLAERWGRVTPGGVRLGLRLSHETLGQLVGCRRASVTTALGHLVESGLVARRSDHTWLLHGSPPDELTAIHWGSGLASPAA